MTTTDNDRRIWKLIAGAYPHDGQVADGSRGLAALMERERLYDLASAVIRSICDDFDSEARDAEGADDVIFDARTLRHYTAGSEERNRTYDQLWDELKARWTPLLVADLEDLLKSGSTPPPLKLVSNS